MVASVNAPALAPSVSWMSARLLAAAPLGAGAMAASGTDTRAPPAPGPAAAASAAAEAAGAWGVPRGAPCGCVGDIAAPAGAAATAVAGTAG